MAIELEARRRTVVGKKVKALRRQGLLPAIMYGAGIEPIPLELDAREATRALSGISGGSLIDLKVNGEVHKVLVREIQRDVIKRNPIHVDFLKVSMTETIRTTVPVELVGEAPAVREKGGVLVTGVSEIEVEALPTDLPERVTVDLEVLEEIEDSISVGDLFLGKGVKVLTDPEELIARVIYQVEEAVEEEEVEVEAVAEPEVIERGKREEEEGESEEAGEEG